MTLHRSVVSIVAALAVLGAWFAHPHSAQACSADEQWDPVETSDVIVGGQIESYTLLPGTIGPPGFIPIQLKMRIDHVWKGKLAAGVEIVDRASLVLEPAIAGKQESRIAWHGSSGACGVFNEDPSGLYAVFGLFIAPDGALQTTGPRTFYLSPRPYDPATIARLSQRIALPVTGHGASERPLGSVGEALLVAGTTLLAAGVAWRIRSRCWRAGGQV